MNRNGIIAIIDEKGREKERYQVVYGAKILFADGAKVKTNDVLLEWDPYTFSILTEVSGVVHFKDLHGRPHHAGAGGRNHRPLAVGGDGFDRRKARSGAATSGPRAAPSMRKSVTSCRCTLT